VLGNRCLNLQCAVDGVQYDKQRFSIEHRDFFGVIEDGGKIAHCAKGEAALLIEELDGFVHFRDRPLDGVPIYNRDQRINRFFAKRAGGMLADDAFHGIEFEIANCFVVRNVCGFHEHLRFFLTNRRPKSYRNLRLLTASVAAGRVDAHNPQRATLAKGDFVRKSKLVRVYGALSFAMLVWGFSFLAIKDVIRTIPPFSLLCTRFVLATLLLGGMLWYKRGFRLPRRDLVILAGLSALSPVGYFLFETFGVAHTQPSHVAVIIATIPAAVYLIAFARKQERPTWAKTAGVAIAYLGILIIVGLGTNDEGASLLGDLLVVGAVICAATRTTLIKDALRRVTPLQLTFYQFFFALVVFIPLAATDGIDWIAQMTPFALFEVLFLGVVCSAVAFLFLHYALAHLSATRVAVSANLVPIITLAAEIAILNAVLTLPKAIGTAITLLGVLLTQLKRSEESPPRVEMESAILKR